MNEPRRRIDLYAPIPPSLRSADEHLHRYGRWAKDRNRLHRCGSAERAYRAPPDDLDREPRAIIMHIDIAMACQRALARVPVQERIVLGILYVPRRLPVEVQLRLLRIPPALCRERHLLGLRMFDNRLNLVHSPSPGTESARTYAVRQPAVSVEAWA